MVSRIYLSGVTHAFAYSVRTVIRTECLPVKSSWCWNEQVCHQGRSVKCSERLDTALHKNAPLPIKSRSCLVAGAGPRGCYTPHAGVHVSPSWPQRGGGRYINLVTQKEPLQ